MKLEIDTTERETLTVALRQDQQPLAEETVPAAGGGQSQELLPAIIRIMNAAGAHWSDLTEIGVATGPGSFTGVRVGVSVANALALALHLPVNGLAVGEFAVPVYGAEPNISKAKPRT